MRRERLDDESVEGSGRLLDGDRLTGSLLDPSASLLPALVQAKESGLSTSLDELVGLADELLGEDPLGEALTGSDGGSDLLGDRVAVRQ